MGDDKKFLRPPPLLLEIQKQFQEHKRKMMDEMFLTIATGKAKERLMEMIGCPPGTDPTEYLRKRLPPDTPYGLPKWISTLPYSLAAGSEDGQEDQDTTEKKEPTQSLSGPLEVIRESLRKGEG